MKTEELSIGKILDRMDEGIYALPEFQRGYVWDRQKVKDLFLSLYKNYPCGTFLLWDTIKSKKLLRKDNGLQDGSNVTLILDGQQRMTSIYGVMRGMEPKNFYDGDPLAFTGLWFNTQSEEFEFYNEKKMISQYSNWVSVSDTMNWNDEELIYLNEKYDSKQIKNIIKLRKIRLYTFPLYKISKETQFQEVIDIFNRVNTGGKKLNDADIAIAKLCGQWDDARRELLTLSKSFGIQYEFDINIILRCITAFLTGSPRYKELDNTTIDDFAASLPIVRNMIGTIIDNLRTRLGLDNGKVIASKYSFVTLVCYLKTKGEKNITHKEWNKMLYWYIHSMLWGRYSSSLISNLAYDLNTIAEGGGIEELIETIKRDRGGNLTISPDDFINRGTTQSTFYPLLYMLTRVHKAKDFAKGILVDSSLLAANSSLEVHHIFPQSRLRSPISTDKHKPYKEELINNIANYALITAQTNQSISNRDPKDYFHDYLDILPTQWIPTEDKSLWEYENYEKFLSARRTLLADAANKLLDELNQ